MSAWGGRERGIGMASARCDCLVSSDICRSSSVRVERQSSPWSFWASIALASRNLSWTALTAERSSVRKPSSRAGGLLEAEAKRSSNEGALDGGSAAVTSEAEPPISATQAAAPSASATAARDSNIVSARPMRRRDNSPSAFAPAGNISFPKTPPGGTHPHPETLYQLPHWEPKVRHNRGREGSGRGRASHSEPTLR